MSRYYIIPIFVPHRGCPHDCVFCNQKKITGVGGNITSEDVRNIIEKFLITINSKKEEAYIEVSFFGGSFTGIPIEHQSELLSVAKEVKLSGRIDAIRLSTRPDYINHEILSNLKDYSVDVIELGVQSMDEEVLRASERGHSANQVRDAVKLIREYDFKLGLQMMTGLPSDNYNKDVYTAYEIIKLKPDFVRIYPSLIIKDTYMEEMYRCGEYIPQSVEEAVTICKKLYAMFYNEGIQIIRIGLQPTDTITSGKDVIGGPFHPAFRELVEGAIINDMAAYIIDNYFKTAQELVLEINSKDISKLFTDKKRYYMTLKTRFKTVKIISKQNNDIKNMSISIKSASYNKIMSIYEYLKMEN